MKNVLVLFVILAVIAGGLLAQAAKDKGPEKLVFDAKTGKVAFDHAKHVSREKGECKTCHPTLWPQKAGGPLNFKTAMHKPAEAKKTSCGACHHPGGTAFASTGNCKKCHGTAK